MENQDTIIEFQRAFHLKREAAKDNIFVDFRRKNGVMGYRVIKTHCRTFESALAQVRYHQSQIVYTRETVS